MERSGLVRAIAVAIGVYGVYVASFVPVVITGHPAPLLVTCLVLESCAALIAAVGLWRGDHWAPAATIAAGAAAALTQGIEGPVLGLIAIDRAVLVGAAAILAGIAIAAYATPRRPALA